MIYGCDHGGWLHYFLISKIFAVQMWGVGMAGGLLPGAAEGIRRLPGARPAGSALPAKLEKLK